MDIQEIKKRLEIAEAALMSIDAVAFDFGYYEQAGRTMKKIADEAIFKMDSLGENEENTSKSLIEIVEGIKGSMEHGTWTDKNGMRLKDTPEWVAFYVENRR